MPLDVADYLRLVGICLGGFTDHDRGYHLAEIGIGNPDHRRFGNAVECVDTVFDLLWIDVQTSGDDQILGAAGDEIVTARVATAEIARAKPSIRGDSLGALRGVAPVTSTDIRPPNLDFADLAVAERSLFAVRDAHGNSRKRQTHRAGDPLAVQRIGTVHQRLGHA